MKIKKTGLQNIGITLLTAFSLVSTSASPTSDDCVEAAGCFATSGGGTAQFDVEAVFDVETHSSTGSLITFTDALAGISVSSSLLTDYADPSTTARNLRFSINSTFADEARVILVDNGLTTSDTFEIQLLQNGNVVYQEGGPLLAACSGGVIVSQDCQPPTVPPCLVDVSASFEYLNCEIIREQPPTPPKCEPRKPNHCKKHCPNPWNCKKHKRNDGNEDCQKVTQPTPPAREVCDVRLTYTIMNTGTVPITSLSASDSFGAMDLSSIPLPIAPGASVSFQVVEEVTGTFQNEVHVTANENGDACSASTEITIQKLPPAPNPCDAPAGPCSWDWWKSHPQCWPVQTITYCGRTYSIADIISALEKLNQYDWFKIVCEKWLTDHLNSCKRK